MKKLTKILILSFVVAAISATSMTALAQNVQSKNANKPNPKAEIVATLTNQTADDVAVQKEQTGNSYGKIAKELGVGSEFFRQNLEVQKQTLDQKVADGKITREEADQIIKNTEEKLAKCDGTGVGGVKKLLKDDRATIKEQLTKIVADLTGKTVDEINSLQKDAKTPLCKIANDAGKLTEYKAAEFEVYNTVLTKKVADGVITQEQYDQYIKKFQEKQAKCDGTCEGAGKGPMDGKGGRGGKCVKGPSENKNSTGSEGNVNNTQINA